MMIAFWAYQENIKTKKEVKKTEELQKAIGQTRSRLAILRAEWAYQNRPNRLQDLADLNYDNLQLLPLRASHFGNVDQIGFQDVADINFNELEPTEVAERR
tara:strand:+ start:113 stop:415 length:303 start_codon:yes stop_codon:yes gene_type:complete